MGAAPRFVGRADELDLLADVLSRAETGQGATVIVVGEPGAGKTALAGAATAGRPARWARAREGGGAPPLWLWEQVLGEPFAESTGAGTSGADRFRRFAAVARRLVENHRADPATIVLDDLQWADPESLAFVDFFAPDAAQHGIVVVGTARSGELVPFPRSDVVVELAGLAPADVGLLLTPPRGATTVEAGLAEAVWRHTGGNPLFITEVDRLLRSRGRAGDVAHWRSMVPEGVRAVIGRRLARLDQRTHEYVVAAAELGEQIDVTVLAQVVGASADDVVHGLAAACATGLLRTEPNGRFTFSHSLVREAARGELPADRRRAVNARAAVALQAIGVDSEVPQIARYLFASDAPDAPEWARRAGEVAYAKSMFTDAATWFATALAAADHPHTRMRWAEALSRTGRSDEAEIAFLDVARSARVAGDVQLLARAALGIGSLGGGFEVRQLDPSQQALIGEAIRAVSGDDSALLATLLARLSVATSLDADVGARVDLADRALSMARRIADPAAEAAALGAWCDAHAGASDIDARALAASDMLVAAQRCGNAELELLARRLSYVAAFEAGDIASVRRHAAAFAALADRLRMAQFTWYARLIEGTLAHLDGDLDRAAGLAAEAARLGRDVNSANAHMLADGALGVIVDRDRGTPGWLERAILINGGIPEANRGRDLRGAFAALAIGLGATPSKVAGGVPDWEHMFRLTWPSDGLGLYAAHWLASAAAFAGRLEPARTTATALEPYADRLVLDGTGSVCFGPVSIALGRVAAAEGNVELARRCFGRALATCRRLGAPLLTAAVERELAAVGGPPVSTPLRIRRGCWERQGDVWRIAFDGQERRLRHTKGLADLAVLIASPSRDIHVFDLVGAAGADRGDAGPVIDAAARRAYQRRLAQLGEAIEAAEDQGDDSRAAALDEERAAMIQQLAGALGLGGAPRRAASDVERARKAVGMRVRDAIRQVSAELPELGRHLQHSVETGTRCGYHPEVPTAWEVST